MCGAGRRGGCCEAVNAAPHRRPENNRSASIAESAVTALELQTCWISFFNTNTQSDQIICHGMSSVSCYRPTGRVLRAPHKSVDAGIQVRKFGNSGPPFVLEKDGNSGPSRSVART